MKAFTSLLLALLGSPFLSAPSYLPPLPLKAPCTWGVATIGMDERALFVSCNSSRFRVYHPKSMYGLILLQNDDQALQFVRFFSSRYTAAMAGLDSRVEVRPMDEERGIDFYYADTRLFAGRFKRASVRSYDGGPAGRIFLIERLVIRPDRRLYWIKERVTQDGNYDLVDEVVLEKNAAKVGVHYTYVH